MMRLVLGCMVGHTPLRPSRPVHCPPSIGSRSKIVGSNPCDSSQRAAISPPGPAPITATLLVISGTVAHRGLQKGRKPACASGRREDRPASNVWRIVRCRRNAPPMVCGVDLLLGIDIGTGSTKGLLVDPSGAVVASEAVSHSMQLPRTGWAEEAAAGMWGAEG